MTDDDGVVISAEIGVRERSSGLLVLSEIELPVGFPALAQGRAVRVRDELGMLWPAVVELVSKDRFGARYHLRLMRLSDLTDAELQALPEEQIKALLADDLAVWKAVTDHRRATGAGFEQSDWPSH